MGACDASTPANNLAPADAAIGELMLARQGVEAGLTWQNISAILEGMEDHIQGLIALGISTDGKKENKNITFGSLEGLRITKRWIWVLCSDEREKGYDKKFLFVCKDRPE
jgi:hypothetical protein